jgi:hypothetical protein
MKYINLNVINAIKDMWDEIEEISRQRRKNKYTT